MEYMRLRHKVDYTIETLTRVKNELGNSRGRHEAWEYRDQWLRWWSAADGQLRNLFADGELAASLSVSAEKVRDVNLGALPFVLLNRETGAWEERLGQVIAELEALKPFIERSGLIVVPDTSAFLEGEYLRTWTGRISPGQQRSPCAWSCLCWLSRSWMRISADGTGSGIARYRRYGGCGSWVATTRSASRIYRATQSR